MMLRKRGAVAGIGVLVFFFMPFFLMPAYSGPINERDQELIKIAYMNGFIAALQLDEKTRADLLEKRDRLKQYVVTKSQEYLNVVKGLNRD